MKCPRCSGKMEIVTHTDVAVDRCTVCRGLWFDASEMDKLREARDSESIDRCKDEAGDRTVEPAGSRLCPRCQTRMIQMVVQDKPHIEYESCTVCFGCFFDAGEFADIKGVSFLERIIDLISR